MSMIVRKAADADVPAIKELLERGQLYHEGVEQFLDGFVVVEEVSGNRIVATAGMEIWGEYGLLRSLVLSKEANNSHFILELVRILLMQAKERKARCVYLYAGNTTDFFRALGFRTVSVNDVPDELKQSPYFRQYSQGLTRARIMEYRFPQKNHNLST